MRPFNCISDSCGTPNSTSVRIKSPFWSNKIFQKYAPVPLGTTSGNNRHSDKSCRPRLIFRKQSAVKSAKAMPSGTVSAMKIGVFFAAVRKRSFCSTSIKFCSPTNCPEPMLSITA